MPLKRINRQNSKTCSCWKIPAIVTCIIIVAVIISLCHYFASMKPMECYQCIWVSHPGGPLLSEDLCGMDQRFPANNSTLKTCQVDQPYCGVLHLSFSYRNALGRLQQFEYAFVRDCFDQYPLPYSVKIGKEELTYYGDRTGNVYPDAGGIKGLNLTVIGQECSSWSLCNSNIPREGWAASFLDSITIIQKAKIKGVSVWKALMDIVKSNNTTAVAST